MIKIGLTGGIGSGKTVVAKMFEQENIPVLYADEIGRDLVDKGQPALEKIVEHFGKTILLDNGHLNRPKLRKMIFEEYKDKEWIENLLHPLIKNQLIEQTKKLEKKYCIIEVPLLLETDFKDLVDLILIVDCDEDTQINRVMKRDGISKIEAQNMIKSQLSRSDRLKYADEVILNESNLEDLQESVNLLIKKYQKLP